MVHILCKWGHNNNVRKPHSPWKDNLLLELNRFEFLEKEVWYITFRVTMTHPTAGKNTGSTIIVVKTVDITTVMSKRSPETTANTVLFLVK